MPTVNPKVLTDDKIDKAKLAAIEHGLQGEFVDVADPVASMLLQDRMAHYRVPDVSIAIIDGDTITSAAYHSSTSSESAATKETLFQAGSISKLVNAVIAMKLVEEGKLKLNEDVNLSLKGWKVPENAHTTSEKVTLSRLLSHTAGLNLGGFPGYDSTIDDANLPTNEAILRGGAYLSQAQQLPSEQEIHEHHLEHQYFLIQDKGESKLFYVNADEQCSQVKVKYPDKLAISIQDLLAAQASSLHLKIALSSEQIQSLIETGECSSPMHGIATNPGVEPIQPPGSAFRYSGGGTQIVQQLIMEAVGGNKLYAEIAKEMVFDPLGMTSSTFAIQRPGEEQTIPRAIGHMGDGSVVAGNWHLYPESAAAGLWTTPTDLAKLVIGIQNNSILNDDTTALMLTPQPNSQHQPGGFLGLGPFLNPAANEFSHTAGTLGFSACCTGFSKGINKGAIIMTNSGNGGALFQELNRSIAASYEWPKEFSDHSIELFKPNPSILSPLAGDYEHPTPIGLVKLTISQKEGRFFITGPFPSPESPPIECELKQASDTTFYFSPDHNNMDWRARITLLGDPPDRFELFGNPAKPMLANVAFHIPTDPVETTEPSVTEINGAKHSEAVPPDSSTEEVLAAREMIQQYKAEVKPKDVNPSADGSEEQAKNDDDSFTP